MPLSLLFLGFKITLGEKDSGELRRKEMKQDGARNKTVLVRSLTRPSFQFPLKSYNFISTGLGLKMGLYYSMESPGSRGRLLYLVKSFLCMVIRSL